MVKLYESGVILKNGREIITDTAEAGDNSTIARRILLKHNTSGETAHLQIRFDCLTSHDITYVNIIQTARAGGLTQFPIPYVLTNCHNSLCAVGGTINEDDHVFGLSAARKYGGIFVPAHLAVIHQYMREMMATGGGMILGSDSHTRYGALGTMAIGEGGGELVKQLLNKTYDLPMPEVIGVYLDNSPMPGVGPMDISLAIIKAVFEKGFVKNRIMEFVGPGIKNLSVDYRNGIDVMTTETACLSSIWQTDSAVQEYFAAHGREDAYVELKPGSLAYYDGLIYVDMAQIKPMIAMPFHPANVYTVDEVIKNPYDIADIVEKAGRAQLDSPAAFSLKEKIENGRLRVDQGVIAGCAGGSFENISAAADIIGDASVGNGGFGLSVYPASQPVFMSLIENGSVSVLAQAGATIRSAFCGPCFGAGDVPANNGFSVRHTTRNFPNREGSKPNAGQIASVALMDARSVAATALNHGYLTSAAEINAECKTPVYSFNKAVYANRVYFGFNRPDKNTELIFGPNITDWPYIPPMPEHLLLIAASVITDPVTTTDELIPSGETSSYRSNPLGLAEFTLSRKDPGYVARAKETASYEKLRRDGKKPADSSVALKEAYEVINKSLNLNLQAADIGIGSFIYAVKPGDGSAREQAASCQRVLGGAANIAREYATKRYRSNLINWGLLPFISDYEGFKTGDMLFVPNIRKNLGGPVTAYLVTDSLQPVELGMSALTDEEKSILLSGSLINYYRA